MDRHYDFVFENENVRVIVDGYGNDLFVASDVAKILGYRDAFNMTRMLNDYEKGTRAVSTIKGMQDVIVITEAGLYHAIMLSHKPNAKAFQRWVFNEVLPDIKRYGAYIDAETRQALDQNPNLVHELNAKLAEYERKASLQPLYHVIDKTHYPYCEFGKLEDMNTKLKDALNRMEDKYYEMYMQVQGVNQMFDHFVGAMAY